MNRLLISLMSASGALFGGASFADDAACWNQQRVFEESEELEETALHFAEVLETIPEYAHLGGRAETLSEEARHFSEAVAGGADCHHLQEDFRVVYESALELYYGVLEAHNRYRNPHVVHDWNDMVAAYDRVRYEVGLTRQEEGRTRSGPGMAGDAYKLDVLR